jgi:multiple sugar transport system substrate-binding protein
VFNKDLFDEAGADYPPTDRSLTWPEYAELCRQVAQPNEDPSKAVYCGSAPDWGFGIYSKWLFGPDGRRVLGNLNSEEHIEAWNVGTALVRDKIAPGQILGTITEQDLFTQKGTAMAWTDFTFIQDYEAAGIDFGIVPSPVHTGSATFVDTWTTSWGTFTESKQHHAALTFLQFMGTEAQRIRPEVSADPPLSTKVAREVNYGAGDPIKQEYLRVLEAGAKTQVLVPPMPEGAWEPAELYNKMTVQGETEAGPLLDAEAKKTQPILDRAWKDWEALA